MSDHLLQAKLTPPPLRPRRVQRARLYAQLEQGLAGRLTLIAAPAGAGKTTLVADWLAQRPMEIAAPWGVGWLSLDETDNDPARFVAYLATACHQANPAGPLIPSPDALTPNPTPATLVTPLLNALAQRPARRLALALDDYHLIHNPTIHQALAFFIEHQPTHLHLILITREEPPLPLPRWRARGQLHELHAAQLRFSPAEADRFLTEVMGLRLAADEAAALTQATEGWAAGLQLVGLALHNQAARSPWPDRLAASTDALSPYWLSEVWQHLAPELQNFLKHTAILERLHGPLCAAVAGPADSEAILAQLAANHLFITPLDGRAAWYRCHPLFRRFLQTQLEQDPQVDRPGLHRRAAEWLTQHDQPAAALPHWLAAGEVSAAAQTLADLALGWVRQGELLTLRRWLDQLPEPLIWRHPQLALARLWLLASAGQPEAVTLNAGRLTADADAPLATEALALLAVAAAMRRRPEEALTLAQQAEAQPGLEDPLARALVAFALAAAYKVGGDADRAQRAFHQAESFALAQGHGYLAFSAAANLGDLRLEQGDLAGGAVACRHALTLLPAGAPEPAYAGWAYWTLGLIHYQWNELETARHYADRSLPLCEAWENWGLAVRAQLLRAQIALAQHAWPVAQSMLDYAERLARRTADPALAQWVTRRRFLAALRQHDRPAARHWLELLRAADPPQPDYAHQVCEAQFALAAGRPDEALHHAQQARRALAVVGLIPFWLQALLLEALARHAGRRSREAQVVLHQALEQGAPGGFVRVFVDEGPEVATLLQQATGHPAYVARLLASFDTAAWPPTARLTPREQEILHLLAAGLSNREMAGRLVVAESTLKRHLSNLYHKLDVHNRAQALAAARERRLL